MTDFEHICLRVGGMYVFLCLNRVVTLLKGSIIEVFYEFDKKARLLYSANV